jgi:hypothetical protein
MGKGTDLSERMKTQELTAEQLATRRAAVDLGGPVEATLDGQLVKPTPQGQTKQVAQAPQQTWD